MAGRNFDHATMSQAFSMPGIDPRVWVSYAIVDLPSNDEGSQTVEFDADDGQLYVNVTLKPSDTPLRARLGMMAAGAGEAVYFPFVGGEEVLVAIPEGNMRAGAVILCRLNNAYDGFPFDSVGGADPTNNAIAIFRTKTALTIESGASVLVRSASAGAMLQLSSTGNVTLRDTKANVLQMSPDVFGFQSGDGATYMQIALGDHPRFNMQIGSTTFTLAGDQLSTGVPYGALVSPLQFVMAAGGTAPEYTAVEHVVTTEALFSILANVLPLALAAAVPPVAWVPPPPNPASPFYAALAAAVATAATTPQNPAVAAALALAFTTATPKPPGVPAQGQVLPGLGCAGFLAGLAFDHGRVESSEHCGIAPCA